MLADDFPAYAETCHLSLMGTNGGNGNVGSELNLATWKDLANFAPGCTGLLDAGVYSGDVDLQVSGNPRGNVILRGVTGTILDGSVHPKQDYVTLQDFELTDADFLDRTQSYYTNPARDGIKLQANFCKLKNLLIHDLKQGVLATYSNQAGAIIEDCIVIFNGSTYGFDGEGHGLYCSNDSESPFIVRRCIVAFNYAYGLHFWAENASGSASDVLDNLILEDCIVIFNGLDGNNNAIIGGSGTNCTVRNPTVRNCVFLTDQSGKYNLNLGSLTASSTGAMVEDNFFIGGTMRLSTYGGEVVTGNKFYCTPELFTSADYPANTYGNEPTEGLDYKLMSNGFLFVANWAQADSVQVDASSLFANGTTVNAKNVQSFDQATHAYLDSQSLLVSGGLLTIDMQVLSRITTGPRGGALLTSTFPKYGVFILEAA